MRFRTRGTRFTPLALALALAGTAAAAHAQQRPPADLALVNANIVDVRQGRVLRGQTVLITGNTIQHVGPSRTTPASAAATVDAAGGYLIPGLWDMHAHLRGNGLPGWLITEWMMPLLLAHGVTGVRDMNSDCDGPSQGPVCLAQMREWQAAIEAGTLPGPRLLALSSWPVDPPWDYDVTDEQARALVQALHERGLEHVKIYNRLSPQALAWIADEAARLGLDTWGHVPLRMTAAAASDAGFRSIEHARDFLFDCFPGSAEFRGTTLSSDPPISVMRAMVQQHQPAACEDVFRTLVRNGTRYVPTHVTRRMEAFADDSAFRNDPRARYLPPMMMAAWVRDADRVVARDSSAAGRGAYVDFYRKGLELTGAAHRAGVQVLLGTDGGDSFVFPGSSVHDELRELVSAGLSPADALRAATWNGAEFLDQSALYGSVAAGKRADLVLLSANPLDDIDNVREIRGVVFGGRYLDRDRLDALLRQAEAAAQRPIASDGA